MGKLLENTCRGSSSLRNIRSGVQMSTEAIAALPMYDFPGLREAHDRLWNALGTQLQRYGVHPVPGKLTRGLSHRETWAHPGLLFGQACEYPLSKSLAGQLKIVATPRYGAPGCVDANYRSAIVVRTEDTARSLDDLRNRRCVINEVDSNSGMNLLRAAVAPLASGGRFFGSVQVSGAHRNSLDLLVAGKADVTAIDCVTLAHLRGFEPALVSRVRIVDWTPASPCLPYVTSRHASEATVEALQSAIAAVFSDPALSSVYDLLLLKGVNLSTDNTFSRIRELELEAEEWGYPTLS